MTLGICYPHRWRAVSNPLPPFHLPPPNPPPHHPPPVPKESIKPTFHPRGSATAGDSLMVQTPPKMTNASKSTTRYVNHSQATKLGGWSPSFLTYARKNGCTAFKTGYIEARLLEDLMRGLEWDEKRKEVVFIFRPDEEEWDATPEQLRFFPDIFTN